MESTNGSEAELSNGKDEAMFSTAASADSQVYPSEQTDSQRTYCEVMTEENDSKKLSCSQSIFSQDTEYEVPTVDSIIKKITEDNSPKSSEVEVINTSVAMVVLDTETDSTSDKSSAITISDSSELARSMESSQLIRRRSLDHSPIPSKRSCLVAEHSVESSTTLDISPVVNITKQGIPQLSTPTGSRGCSSPSGATSNLQKRSESCNICCEVARAPARRLKRSLSADIDARQKKMFASLSPNHFKKMSKITESSNNNSFKKVELMDTDSEATETPRFISDSQSFGAGDSQSVKLFLSPSSYDVDSPLGANILSAAKESKTHNDTSETNCMRCDDVVHLSEVKNNARDISNGELQKLSLTDGNTDHDSTASIDMDSSNNELPDKLNIKLKPYLSNGYSSSTPENAPFAESLILKKTFHISDSEGDNTPPFTEYGKQPDGLSKLSITSKSDTSSNRNSASNSFLNNGHSNGSHYSNASHTVPTFNLQVYTDENNDFLSMFIVKSDNELGNQVLKEYQRLSRRLTIDPYSGDASKSSSPSSVTSGGLLHLPQYPRSSFMSTTSSTSSSSRTSDGAFIIPRPRKNISSHTQPATVKGVQGLRQKLYEILTSLSEVYGPDDANSPLNSDDKNLSVSADKIPKNSDGTKSESNDCHRTTPKSTKKKTKTKRVLSGRIKKGELSITNEEHESEGIHSPEMLPSDTDKCQQSQTPFRSDKQITLDDNPQSPKATPRMKSLKSASPAVSATCANENATSTTTPNFISYPEGTLVLAKWVDRRYYSGKVKQLLDSNKYLIQFDDGQSKTLLDDFIIFGNSIELPLVGQSIYAMVDDEQTYEPSLVLEVDRTESGSVCYKCTTDGNSMISVVAAEIYLTEDQAKAFKEANVPKSPHSNTGTPRRRTNRELDLDNIIQGPRSARLRDKGTTPKGVLNSPSSSKASTSSGARSRGARRIVGAPKPRQESESSEGGDSRASSVALEEVGGVQPEVQKTPRKLYGIEARDLHIKGSSKQIIGKRSSKVTKFEVDEDTVSRLGPIPQEGSTFFSGLHFLLTCTEFPRQRESRRSPININDSEQLTESSADTEKDEENLCVRIPFQKERLKEQLERGGGIVYSHFEDIPKGKYGVCKLIGPRPCLTAKYIQCLGANIRALSHTWVIQSCLNNKLMDQNEFALPTGLSIERKRMIRWKITPLERISATPFKDKLILLCSDNDNFTKFWERVCSLAGANTRILTEDNLELGCGIAIVTENDCPHEVQNKANLESVPLVSTIWVVQCLIDGKLLSFDGSSKYNFAYNDNE